MSLFNVFSANVEEEYNKWLSVWESWPDREIMAHPDYVRLFARDCDSTLCAIQQNGEGFIIFPFILRPLCNEPWATQSNQYDIVSPYGYGGPFAWGLMNTDYFWSELAQWAENKGVICLFARISLFPEQTSDFGGITEVNCYNVVRSLNLTPQEMWMDYEHKVRKNVKKALAKGLRVTVDSNGDNLEDFLSIYYATMNRRNALEKYSFSRAFFDNLINNLIGQYEFFHVWQESRIISSELVLVSQNNIYSFLGGTMEETYSVRPNDLLKHFIIEWGIEQEKKNFVLGGGYNNEDGIFRYKTSFAPEGVLPFKVGKIIYQPDAYLTLIDMRQSWEDKQGNEWTPHNSFFPLYRS